MQLNQSQRSFFNGGRGLGFGVLAHIKYPNYKLSLYWKILFGLAKSCMKIFLSYSNPSENIMRYLPFPNLHGYAGKHFAPKKNWLIKFQVEWKNVLRKHANLKWKRIPIPWSTVLRHYCAMHSNRNWSLIAIKLTIKSNQIKCKKWKKNSCNACAQKTENQCWNFLPANRGWQNWFASQLPKTPEIHKHQHNF